MAECSKCRGKNKNGHVKLSINEVDYKLKLDTLICKECAKDDFLIDFNKFKKQIIKKGEGIVIDWKYYSKIDNKEMKVSLSRILLALSILDYRNLGNWEIVGKGSNLNPKIEGQILYFKRESDVVGYAKVNYPWTSYQCEVRRISRVIKQDEFNL